jgi:hypothetical protein
VAPSRRATKSFGNSDIVLISIISSIKKRLPALVSPTGVCCSPGALSNERAWLANAPHGGPFLDNGYSQLPRGAGHQFTHGIPVRRPMVSLRAT